MGARLLLAFGLLWVCACGGVQAARPDAGGPGPDAALIDGGGGGGDGGPTPAHSARETVSGAGRVTGGAMTMDVQIGHAISQKKASGGTVTVEGGAAVKP